MRPNPITPTYGLAHSDAMPFPCATWLPRAHSTTGRARRLLTGLVAAATIATANGCASGRDNINQATREAATSASASAASTPNASAILAVGTATTPRISAPAVEPVALKAVGQARVDATWASASAFAREWSFREAPMRKSPQELTTSDFDGLRSQMTPRARKDFDTNLAKAKTKPDTAGSGLSTAGMNAGGYQLRDVDPVTDYVVDGAVTTVEDRGRLSAVLRMRATLHVVGTDGAWRYPRDQDRHALLRGRRQSTHRRLPEQHQLREGRARGLTHRRCPCQRV